MGPTLTTGTERDKMAKIVSAAGRVSTVVDDVPHHPKVKGLSPTFAIGTESVNASGISSLR